MAKKPSDTPELLAPISPYVELPDIVRPNAELEVCKKIEKSNQTASRSKPRENHAMDSSDAK